MLDEGRRAEARPLLEAYVLYCLEHKPAGEARELLTEMGRIALTAKAALPVAEGLNAWEERYGELPTSDRLLAGGLYYAAGRNREAYRLLSAVEPHVAPEVRHRWCLVAMASALLRMDREEDAENVLSRLQAAYPGAAEADELRYRFGVYYFRRRRLEEARQAFESLRDGATQQAYAQLCDEYLVRVEHLRRITETRERADES
jgi:hypothetical protein